MPVGTAVELGKIEYLDARIVWASESSGLTPWLAENLDRLGEALGLDLELQRAECAVGCFRADISARDISRDRQVIIENQLEPTDHGHLGQLLTYAAGLDAAVIVWISPEIREEHRAALDWLNLHTSENIEFFGVALQIARIGDSKPAVVFRLAASPNAWGKQKASAGVAEEATGKGLAYQDFFQPVIDQLREKYRFTNARSAPRRHYFEIRSGAVSGVLYNAAFANSRRLLRAELYIDTSSGERNKAIFDALKARKNEIEAETGGLDWERLDHRRASRISLIRPNTGIEDAQENGRNCRTGWYSPCSD